MPEVALVEHEPNDVHVVTSESAAIFSLIERAARDPNVDIDKMERLLLMQERVQSRNAKAAYAAAFKDMQPKLPVVGRKGKNTNTKQAYAKWEDIAEAIAPIIAAHGFSLSFKVHRADGVVSVTGVLLHEQGHSEETTLDLPVDTGAGRNAVQAVGSSVSYGKRYVAGALLNFVSRDEPDDDGKAAGNDGPITKEQVSKVLALIEETGTEIQRYCEYLGVEAVADITVGGLPRALAVLEKKKAKNNG